MSNSYRITPKALARLEDAGAPQELLAELAQVSYVLADLEGSTLALTDAGVGQVIIDSNAAGHGWFVDPTPTQDEEFASGAALPGSRAEGQMDLLTTVLHEMGHLAGLEHTPGGGLMAEVLLPGVRQVQALDAVFGQVGV